jgi:hypothetical protein
MRFVLWEDLVDNRGVIQEKEIQDLGTPVGMFQCMLRISHAPRDSFPWGPVVNTEHACGFHPRV